ncbi:MAG: tRNA-(ms[2]io[6]A)-hydroxylase [Acidobacteria bacterium]|nr:tRNA-(ms[2]io[6]A)-hydroxylase [Acidobacteriota bacterium]MCI0621488.1 tRNA-(ms[2]io[6]A)-hydroxylase [Acidobacteriota bacterium]MCI0718833.1 tRNA-(ms[2]io[6]A)-hydroxylase [Acidobacteriota bacterium]
MNLQTSSLELPLRYRTPECWAEQVLRHPLALLNDHAYLEKKAASNALELMNRWPEPVCPEGWVATLASIGRDEAAHLHSVTRLLAQRGGKLERLHKNPYAHDLRELVRKGAGACELLDRLLVSALIEARSCERFDVLSRACADLELARFYRSLWASEFGHYTAFLRLAEEIVPEREVEERWGETVEAEARIIASQPAGPRMHSGLEST